MKKSKIAKGQPLAELAKGSLEYTSTMIHQAFRSQFRADDMYWNWMICEIFAEYVIVYDSQLPPDEYWRVHYTTAQTSYQFASRDAWELVELAYQSAARDEAIRVHRAPSIAASFTTSGDGIPLVESLDRTRLELCEAQAGKPRRIRARGMTADIINRNNRRYASEVLRAAVAEAQPLAERGELLAESGHPTDKPSGTADILESLVRWDSIVFDGGEVLLEGEIIPTSKGRDLITIMEAKVYPRLSQRAYGRAEQVEEGGRRFLDIKELHITGYDLVMDPGDPTAATLAFESFNPQPITGDPPTMDRLTLEALRTEYPELVAQIVAESNAARRAELESELEAQRQEKAREQEIIQARERTLRESLGLGETDDLAAAIERQNTELQRLQEAEQARAVAAYIAEECGKIRYAEILKPQFAKRVENAHAKTIEEAKQAIVAARAEYDALQASIELHARGRGQLSILGPVLESELGVPEFARASYELTESLIRHGQAEPRNLRKPSNINERFTVQYLERFDSAYRHHLANEARLFNEAEQTSDLNLPYSVMRTIIAEALPELVALSIFDVQMVDMAPTTNIWFENYAAESGATGSVTDEVVTAALNTWVNLANAHLDPGSVVLTNSGATVTYTEGTDYVVDYLGGRLMAIATITNGQSLKIDYTYQAMRRGEMAAIKRGKNQLTSKSLTIAADRLAVELSTESIQFSRAALGYDARARLLARLVRQIQNKIDGGLFYLALAAALQVASNSGGTWTAASDDPALLAKYIGVAKVKIANRNYEPTAVLMSKTNSDRLANWDGYTQAGSRVDADLNSAGYSGRVKGLPVFDTTNFTDGYVLPINREVVLYRIAQPMQIKGPIPSFDFSAGQVVAGEQYYVEEFNGAEAPVPQKAASVKIA